MPIAPVFNSFYKNVSKQEYLYAINTDTGIKKSNFIGKSFKSASGRIFKALGDHSLKALGFLKKLLNPERISNSYPQVSSQHKPIDLTFGGHPEYLFVELDYYKNAKINNDMLQLIESDIAPIFINRPEKFKSVDDYLSQIIAIRAKDNSLKWNLDLPETQALISDEYNRLAYKSLATSFSPKIGKQIEALSASEDIMKMTQLLLVKTIRKDSPQKLHTDFGFLNLVHVVGSEKKGTYIASTTIQQKGWERLSEDEKWPNEKTADIKNRNGVIAFYGTEAEPASFTSAYHAGPMAPVDGERYLLHARYSLLDGISDKLFMLKMIDLVEGESVAVNALTKEKLLDMDDSSFIAFIESKFSDNQPFQVAYLNTVAQRLGQRDVALSVNLKHRIFDAANIDSVLDAYVSANNFELKYGSDTKFL